MFSYISSSSFRGMALAAAVAAALLGWHEYSVRGAFWTGMFMYEFNPFGRKLTQEEALAAGDTIIIGSSRGVEALRPSILEVALKKFNWSAYNASCHSCTSVDLIHSFVRLYRIGEVSNPKLLIVTVEPLHFSTYFVRYDRPNVEGDIHGGLIDRSRYYNKVAQQKIADQFGSIIYPILRSAQVIQRRKIPLWFGAAGGIIGDTIWNKRDLRSAVAQNYRFYILDRATRIFTAVSEIDKGFEGHTLRLTQGATRSEAFKLHALNYTLYVLPNYNTRYFSAFMDNLRVLQSAGACIVLARLPIYDDLYKMEQAGAPDFDDQMSTIARQLDIPYLALQERFKHLSRDPEAFTDGSHMENDKTRPFTFQFGSMMSSEMARRSWHPCGAASAR